MNKWHFQRPGVGLDTGGDISKAFRGESQDLPGFLADHDPGHSARLLARELIQNAVDAHDEHKIWCEERGLDTGGALRLEFSFETLEGEALRALVDAVDLQALDARADTVTPQALKLVADNYFAQGDTGHPLRILRVNERRTTGMFGPWAPPDGGTVERRLHAALLDFGTSAKSGRAGGSYGYGKAGLANASRLRTVFAYTCFSSERATEDKATRRLIGVSYWDKHVFKDREYIGVGVFGAPYEDRDGFAKPWDDEVADTLAAALRFPVRDPDAPNDLGTSYLVLDPDFDATALRTAVELFWWPALRRGSVEITIRDEDVHENYSPRGVGTDVDLNAFATALTWLDEPAAAPAADDPHGTVVELREQAVNQLGVALPSPGRVALLVDKADDGWSWNDPTSRTLVALIRGTNMVIAYQPYGTGLPNARGVFSASAEAGPLLRATETKTHDKWEAKPDPGIPAEAVQMAAVTKSRIRDAVNAFVSQLKPDAPTREVSLDIFGQFFSGRSGTQPPRPPVTRDAWSINFTTDYDVLANAPDGTLAQAGEISIGLSGNTTLDQIPVTVELKFGATEDGSGFGTEDLSLSVECPSEWCATDAGGNQIFEGTLTRGTDSVFTVSSAPYPDTWECGFQAVVSPSEDVVSGT